jgi:nucleoside phosphorylase
MSGEKRVLRFAQDDIMVVSATERELAVPDGWRTLCCGVGPVEAAAATAAAIAQHRPRAILHVGIAGSRRRPVLEPPSLIIGAESVYCDVTLDNRWAPRTISPSSVLLEAAQRVLPDALTLPIGTSARVGGTSGVDIEAMEGFAVLRAAQLANIPAIEIRAIANEIQEPDRARWRFDEAFAAIVAVTPRLVAEFAKCVN